MDSKEKPVMLEPMAKDTRINLRIDERFKAKLDQAAAKRGMSVTALIMYALTKTFPELMD